MDEKISPCPFCLDGKPYAVYEKEDMPSGLISHTHYVICDCGAKSPERYGPDARQEAIDAWNRRAPQPLRRWTAAEGTPPDGLYYGDVESLLGVKVFVGTIRISQSDDGHRALLMPEWPQQPETGGYFEDECYDVRGVVVELAPGDHRVAYWYMSVRADNEDADLYVAEENEIWQIFDALYGPIEPQSGGGAGDAQ